MRRISNSVEETIRIGVEVAKKLKKGDVVALVGNLGAGKTVFTKGIAKGLGVKDACYVNSPTFVIIKEYKGRLPLYHFDIYRLLKSSSIDIETYEEYFYGDGVTVVEWADKIKDLLPPGHILVNIRSSGESTREIAISRSVAG